MRKIKLKHDMTIPGYGFIQQGTMFKVDRFNSRFVYVSLGKCVTLRLARKGDCEVVY